MAKFEVIVTERVEQAVKYTVKVTKEEVVNTLGLEGNDKKEWKDHVYDFIEQDLASILELAERGDSEDTGNDERELDSVSEA